MPTLRSPPAVKLTPQTSKRTSNETVDALRQETILNVGNSPNQQLNALTKRQNIDPRLDKFLFEARADRLKNTMGDANFEQLMAAINGVSGEVSKLRDEQNRNLAGMNDNINQQMSSMGGKINSLERATTKVVDDISGLSSRMNHLEQEALAMQMEIKGIQPEHIDSARNNPRDLALRVIKSFNIAHQPNTIKSAFFREMRITKTFILVVIFDSIEEKVKVMKQRKNTKDGIFFDHAMTRSTRELLMYARRAAKDTPGLKAAILKRGEVFIISDDEKLHKIFNKESADKLRLPQPISTMSTQSGSSASTA